MAKQCQVLWQNLLAPKNNAYCKAKGVSPDGARQDEQGRLVVPFYNIDGEMTTIQRISGNGFKQFAKGGQKAGSFLLLKGTADEQLPHVMLLCEGFATGQTLSKATGLPVCICGDSGNLVAVSKVLAEKTHGKTFIVAGDDDRTKQNHLGKENVGRQKACEAAKLLGGATAFPIFPNRSHSGTDFNDLMQSAGIETVKRQIKSTVALMQNVEGRKVKSKLENKSASNKEVRTNRIKR